jgi:hypothetical protein
MYFLSILFAGIDAELIKAIVILVFLALAGLAKLLSGMQQVPPGQRPRVAPPPAEVSDEIEDFLRRAAQRQSAPQSPPAQPVRQIPKKFPRPAVEPILAVAVDETTEKPQPKPVGGQVTEHVQKYLDAGEFSRRTSRLGDEVAQTDREIDEHLHQVFDHTVSRLSNVPGEAAAPPVAVAPPGMVETSPDELATSAENLLAVFSDPDLLCQAVVLSEILHRPEERWG